MTLLYVEPVDEESSWHMPICRVLYLFGGLGELSMNVIDIHKVPYIKRGGIKEKQ
jgi:hypothetical protein